MRFNFFTVPLILFWSVISWADCTAPLAVAGQFIYFAANSEMQVCDGTYWLTLNNGTPSVLEGDTTGCSLFTTTQGQLVYGAGIYKMCFYTTFVGAFKMKSGNVMTLPPSGISASTGKLYFDPSYKEPFFYDGAAWYRMRKNPMIYTAPGTYTLVAPKVQSSLVIKAWGAGGGASRVATSFPCNTGYTNGNAGSASTISGSGMTTVSAGGGGGGTTVGGTGGATSGGGVGSAAGSVGGAPNGGDAAGAGGGLGATTASTNGGVPGGGGAGNSVGCLASTFFGRGGGGGAYTTQSFGVGAITPGTVLTIVVGTGGTGATGTGNGGDGRVEISWD